MTAAAIPAAEAPAPAPKSSFSAGMRVLPKAEREAMYAIYAFCREVDDIADEQGSAREDQQKALDAWRADVEALYADGPPGRMAIVAEAVRRYGLAKADFLAVIDGMEMDLVGVQAPDLATLDLYCDRVASAVGRLSVKVFGMDEAPGLSLAHHLGRALQLTNILRDVDEDAEIGRLYLPKDYLDAEGVETADLAAVIASPQLDGVCRRVAVLAEAHYREADRLMARRPAGRLAAPRLMSAVYGHIFRRMRSAGWGAPRARVKIGKATLLWIVLRRGVFG
jgi:phytoene synthase